MRECSRFFGKRKEKIVLPILAGVGNKRWFGKRRERRNKKGERYLGLQVGGERKRGMRGGKGGIWYSSLLKIP